jgi:hypothetical protein
MEGRPGADYSGDVGPRLARWCRRRARLGHSAISCNTACAAEGTEAAAQAGLPRCRSRSPTQVCRSGAVERCDSIVVRCCRLVLGQCVSDCTGRRTSGARTGKHRFGACSPLRKSPDSLVRLGGYPGQIRRRYKLRLDRPRKML